MKFLVEVLVCSYYNGNRGNRAGIYHNVYRSNVKDLCYDNQIKKDLLGQVLKYGILKVRMPVLIQEGIPINMLEKWIYYKYIVITGYGVYAQKLAHQ